MPVVVAGPYPSVQQILDLARVLINDTYNNGAGVILTNSAPMTLPLLNASIVKLRLKLANNNVSTVIKDNVILSPILPVEAVDPSVQQFISFSGFFDGTNMFPYPYLPPDLIVPQFLWERQTGSGLPFIEMTEPEEGLQSRFQYPNLGQWEWRTDQINFVGSTESRDIRLRYEAQVLTPIQVGSDFTVTTIGSIDSQLALAYDVAATFAEARGSAGFQSLKMSRDAAIEDMVNRYVRRDQGTAYNREPFGGQQNQYPGGNIQLP